PSPDGGRDRVRVQALRVREERHVVRDGFQALGGIVGEVAALYEIIHAQGAGKARGAHGGQGVVRAGEVVPKRLRAVVAEEHGARVTHPAQPVKGPLHTQLQVLRRYLVGDIDRLAQIVRDDYLAVGLYGGARYLAPGQD